MNKNYHHVIEGISAEIAIDNIDTDQIIPTEYLKSIKKYGFGDFLFDGWSIKKRVIFKKIHLKENRMKISF